jgi:hypothetical protein
MRLLTRTYRHQRTAPGWVAASAGSVKGTLSTAAPCFSMQVGRHQREKTRMHSESRRPLWIGNQGTSEVDNGLRVEFSILVNYARVAMSAPSAATPPFIFRPVITDLLIPILLLGIAARGKKSCQNRHRLVARRFLSRPDLCSAAVSTGLLRIFALLRHLPVPKDDVTSFASDVASSALLKSITQPATSAVLLPNPFCGWYSHFPSGRGVLNRSR